MCGDGSFPIPVNAYIGHCIDISTLCTQQSSSPTEYKMGSEKPFAVKLLFPATLSMLVIFYGFYQISLKMSDFCVQGWETSITPTITHNPQPTIQDP